MQDEHDRVMAEISNELASLGDTFTTTDLSQLIHEMNRAKGFWDMAFVSVPLPDDADMPSTIEFDPHLRNTGEAIALMHSELSEALEAHRNAAMDDKLPQYPGVFVELADTLIRILDYFGAHGVDPQPIIVAKMLYNAQRPHKHGKAY